jgi:hypothetical protein
VQRPLLVIATMLALIMTGSAQQVSSSTDASISSSQTVSEGKSTGSVQSSTSANAGAQTNVTTPTRKDTPSATKSQAHKNPDGNSSSSSSARLTSGTAINAVLSKPVDSKKAKPGDEIVATTSEDVKSNGKVVIRRGSKLIGHVTQAQARAAGDANSSLAIVFDHALLKDGQQVEVNSVVQALAPPATAGVSSADTGVDTLAAGSAGGNGAVRGAGVLGGVSSTAGAATGAVVKTAGTSTGVTNSTLSSVSNSGKGLQGALNSSSTGVIGLKGLSLAGDAANSTQGSVITSTGKAIHLDSGTQMVLRVVN